MNVKQSHQCAIIRAGYIHALLEKRGVSPVISAALRFQQGVHSKHVQITAYKGACVLEGIPLQHKAVYRINLV